MSHRTKIVVGANGTEPSRDALALARVLGESLDARVLAAYVFPREPHAVMLARQYQRGMREQIEGVLKPALEQLDGVASEACPVSSSSAARGLYDLAEEEKPDLLVLGATHRGPVGRILIGSVGERLLHGSPSPVAVAPRGFADQAEASIRTVGVACDGAPAADAALAAAVHFARAAGWKLRLLAVVEPAAFAAAAIHPMAIRDEVLTERRRELAAALEHAQEALPDDVQSTTELLDGDPAHTLSEADGIDALVVGSRDYGATRRVMLGSVSSPLMRSAPFPVIVVPDARSGIGSPA